eukprot:Nitzschia sp. Nitz4//scaffold85_size83877//13680//15091//NITZ4_005218-RA/size83877-augustus-gene-0.158-mRNA-1//-1//CDS//3329559104//6936//frame0
MQQPIPHNIIRSSKSGSPTRHLSFLTFPHNMSPDPNTIDTETSGMASLLESEDVAPNSSMDSMYKYRDFSNVGDEEFDQPSPSPASPPPPGGRGVESSIRVQKFPVKLYAILAQKEFHDIITWMPHGRSWKVLKPNLFESLVMPLFFEYSNYHSFNRLVNAWSFRRISTGPDRGSYYHELFLRGKPHLQKFMRRLPKTHKKLPMKKEDEPDFYALDKAQPLPTLEEVPLPPTAMMPAMRQQQAIGGASSGMLTPANMMPPMPAGAPSLGMTNLKDFEPRESLIGMMGQSRGTGGPSLGMNGMGMNGMGMNGMGMNGMGSMGNMGSMGSMGPMNGMGSMGAAMNGMGPMNGMGGQMNGMMNGIGAMNGLHGLAGMNAINSSMGMNSLRDSGAFGASTNGMGGDLDLQRLRQLQQMRMMEQQLPGSSGVMSMNNDALSVNMRLSRQPC